MYMRPAAKVLLNSKPMLNSHLKPNYKLLVINVSCQNSARWNTECQHRTGKSISYSLNNCYLFHLTKHQRSAMTDDKTSSVMPGCLNNILVK